jgi:hypothetical protein
MCDDYMKGVFLLNHGDLYFCIKCRTMGFAEFEHSSFVGSHRLFKEVRVEFDYLAIEQRYKSIAIVRDESAPVMGKIYTFWSPLIKTEKRALVVAESLLANLNRMSEVLKQGDVPTATALEININKEGEGWKREMERFRRHIGWLKTGNSPES